VNKSRGGTLSHFAEFIRKNGRSKFLRGDFANHREAVRSHGGAGRLQVSVPKGLSSGGAEPSIRVTGPSDLHVISCIGDS
jgi:hypothetical protein